MKIAVIGSRTFNDYEKLQDWLLWLFPVREQLEEIISGGAKGADTLAERFADWFECKKTIIRPDWNSNGKAAGFVRNQQIIDSCDMVVAFWDGQSKGTKDSIMKAKVAKKPTFIIYF